ncbi:MAG: response regulator [Nitrososphaeria archaeon]|nr:response regulator [Nitrososphaeria archaeon]NIN52360.1 response regulator [Nitrososphaeria archaeon]NIQ32838.1 response regulator [Nitrososphaeria archaeon]
MEKKTILVVDDEENVRVVCHQVLSEKGYKVIEAEDGEEALKKVRQENPDLVILDIQMSRMDGMEALPKILRRRRNMPVILYTGYTGYKEDFMTRAADAYIVKSPDLTELIEKVKQLLSARAPNGRMQ